MSAVDPSDARLGTNVTPKSYALTIKTDLESLTFSGTSETVLSLLSPGLPDGAPLVLNVAPPLVIRNAVLVQAGERKRVKEVRVVEGRERVELYFEGGVRAGEAKLGLWWEGKLEGSMKGYYTSAYPKEEGGGTAFYAVTQFQPTHARRAFPCFDEPNFKATYSIALLSRTSTVSLSNTDMISVGNLGSNPAFPRTEILLDEFLSSSLPSNDPVPAPAATSDASPADWELVTFRPTPPMSSYIVAFANGDFRRKGISLNGVDLNFYATWDCIDATAYSLEVSRRVLPIYERVFGIKYPLKKLDTLVVADFDLGAMENWGLIMGRKSVYMWDEKSGLAARKGVASTTSHEISHQWFGNIVTMGWWDALWLNESFATLIGEIFIIDEIEPSWKAPAEFIAGHLTSALTLDALRSSHPIEMSCPDEASIVAVFDSISYSKGASVLKMLSKIVGKQVFLAGVKIYLEAHLFGNATTADLFAGISKASGKDVAIIMREWTTKIGFPVLTIEETSEGLRIRQNRFLSTGDPTEEENETLWHVPLEFGIISNGKAQIDHDIMLKTREMVLPLKDVANVTYKLNFGTAGVYRVLYPTDRLAKLGEAAGAKKPVFAVVDRMGLVQDAFVLASSGASKTSGSLALISRLGNETENLVWWTIRSGLLKLSAAWWEQPKSDREAIERLGRRLLGPVAERLGFEYAAGDDSDTTELRTLAISYAASCGVEAILKEYRIRFARFLEHDDESAIPADLRRSIYTLAVGNGGEREYEKVLAVYRNPPTPSHKTASIAGLCSSEAPELYERTFALVLSPEVKTQDIASFANALAANTSSRRRLWSFFTENYEELMTRFKGNFQLKNLITAACSSFTSAEDAATIEQFFSQHDTAPYATSLMQSIDSVRAKAAWIARDKDDVHEWLEENVPEV